MSIEFFKLIKNHQEGNLYIITSSPKEDEIGLKLFIANNENIYNKSSTSLLWDGILDEMPSNILGSKTYNLSNNYEVFAEKLHSKPTLVLCGGGHVSQAVYKLAVMIGFEVIIIDDRIEFSNTKLFPKAQKVYTGNFKEILSSLNLGSNIYYAVITRGHSYDGDCLEAILNKEYTYLGMIGSTRKREVIYKSLRSQSYSENQISTIHSPIGLPIGAETPEEIAISIMGEIIQHKSTHKLTSFIDDEALNFIADSNDSVVLSLILEKTGSIPRGAGSKMIVSKSGYQVGTIGGGSIEHESKIYSTEIINKNMSPTIKNYTMHNDDAKKSGMACGGRALLYIEPLTLSRK